MPLGTLMLQAQTAWSGCVLGGPGLCAFVSKGIRFGDEELPIDLRAVGSKLSTSSVACGTENASFSGRGLWMQETGLRSHTSQQLLCPVAAVLNSDLQAVPH